MSLAWTYKEWSGRFPSLSSDEYYRHTLVLPNPLKVNSIDPEDGTKYYPALILVVAPWWACRHVFDAEHRKEARAGREESRALAAEMKAEDEAEAQKPA
jgi:hypothetical protein